MLKFFKKFKEGLAKTSQNLVASSRGLFGGKRIDAAAIDQLEEALYASDFGLETTEEILDAVKRASAEKRDFGGTDFADIGSGVLREVLAGSEGVLPVAGPSPTVICLIGVNGSGKTTTAAKLAHRLQQEGSSVMLGACDTFRAAANEQLKIWADRLSIDLVASHQGADSAAVAFDAHQAARRRQKDYLILDTAGRLHTKANLMEELAKIKRVLRKTDPAAPHCSLLVVDGSLGANSIEQAAVFHESFGLDGLIVTKLDGTSRGGAIVGIYRELKVPIHYLGLGEQPEDLQPFTIDYYINALFGREAA